MSPVLKCETPPGAVKLNIDCKCILLTFEIKGTGSGAK